MLWVWGLQVEECSGGCLRKGGYSARREENVWDKGVPGGGLGKVTCYPEERGL